MNQSNGALLLKMAQQAARDPDLLAASIDAAAQSEPGGWQALAGRLQIDESRLARLALCRRPAAAHLESDTQQIAQAVGIHPDILGHFLDQPAVERTARPARIPAAASRREGRRSGWAVGLSVGLVMAGLLLLSAFIFAGARGSQATLVVQQGQAQVLSGGWLSAWLASAESVVSAGQMVAVKTGDRISTGAQSAAELRLIDGSSVVLAANTQLVVQELNTTQATYRVRLQQASGATFNRVMRLLGVGDVFEIETPSSTVSVRGTEFSVAVQAEDRSWIGVVKGVVHVALGDEAVDVRPGQQVLAQVGQPLIVVPLNNPVAPPVQPTQTVPPATPGPQTGQATPAAPTVAAPTAGTPVGPTPGVSVTPLPVGAPELPAGQVSPVPPNIKPPVPANGPPEQVPGSPPEDTPGKGDPPDGGGDPPGREKDPPKKDPPTKEK